MPTVNDKKMLTEDSDFTKFQGDILPQKYVSAMVLSAVADAIGFYNGVFEFTESGVEIMNRVNDSFGGIENIVVDTRRWIVSDDTVMLLATLNVLIRADLAEMDHNGLMKTTLSAYKDCMDDMDLRAPGRTCVESIVWHDDRDDHDWRTLPFSTRGGGCGASMRTAVIGARFPGLSRRHQLIAYSIDSSRLTHQHPTGYLGGFVAALFSAYALEGVRLEDWGAKLIEEDLPRAYEYIDKKMPEHRTLAGDDFNYFERAFVSYLELRGIRSRGQTVQFPSPFGVAERDEYYKQISFRGMGGASGHDSCIIAYDALLGCKGDWISFLERGALHGGDSDSTGAIGAFWFGLLYGSSGVPRNHFDELEKKKELIRKSFQLYAITRMDLESDDPDGLLSNYPVVGKEQRSDVPSEKETTA